MTHCFCHWGDLQGRQQTRTFRPEIKFGVQSLWCHWHDAERVSDLVCSD
jgi:hypothetical protein